MKSHARRLAYKAGSVLAALLLMSTSAAQTPHQAYLNWPALEQYQAQGQLLTFSPPGNTKGSLLIWPEFNQAHVWLPVARYWQQHHWQVNLLLPDAAQHQFDPSSEHPSSAQQAWQTQQQLRLTQLEQAAESDSTAPMSDSNVRAQPVPSSPLPLLVLAQGSAALWYQQWVDAGELSVPQALILFDALPKTHAQQSMLAVSLARSPYPILDIYSEPESPLAWHNQQQRQQQLHSREKTGYAQLRIKEPISVIKPIAGWLVRLGWLPLPPSAPHYLQEQHSESGISRPRHPAASGPAAPP